MPKNVTGYTTYKLQVKENHKDKIGMPYQKTTLEKEFKSKREAVKFTKELYKNTLDNHDNGTYKHSSTSVKLKNRDDYTDVFNGLAFKTRR